MLLSNPKCTKCKSEALYHYGKTHTEKALSLPNLRQAFQGFLEGPCR
jgi:hypothetical protein